MPSPVRERAAPMPPAAAGRAPMVRPIGERVSGHYLAAREASQVLGATNQAPPLGDN
jgi:hypothetical protein